MIVTVADTEEKKIIKHVNVVKGELVYVSYCFLWNGPFRLIYRNNNPANFTAWFLDRHNGIWGCFADDVDIGFDHAALIESLTLDLSAKEANDHRSLEKVEDMACEKFFDIMTSHIDQLFPPKGW
jgi:hypothetical protein